MSDLIFPKTFSFTTKLKLSPEGKEILLDMAAIFPDECPACRYQHESATFVQGENGMQCDRCSYILESRDLWPRVIE